MRLLVLALFLMLPVPGYSTPPCNEGGICPLADRSYHIRLPDEWDGVTPMPLLLHFHGWGRQGDLIVKHQRIAGHTRRRGVLLVAPNGQGRTWDFRTAESRDVDFAAAVLPEVARRYPIDRDRIFVSGYSYGAAMAWRYVCQRGNGIAALIAVSGTLRQSDTCPQAPRAVRHVHGLADQVMAFPMGAGDDATYPVQLWRDRYGCGAGQHRGAWQAVTWLSLDRHRWTCPGGTVTLDVHPGGHFIPHGWIGWQLDQLMGQVPRYP